MRIEWQDRKIYHFINIKDTQLPMKIIIIIKNSIPVINTSKLKFYIFHS